MIYNKVYVFDYKKLSINYHLCNNSQMLVVRVVTYQLNRNSTQLQVIFRPDCDTIGHIAQNIYAVV